MHPVRSLVLALAGCVLLSFCVHGEEKPSLLYPAGADAQGNIARAVEKAMQENKHVLIQWGANWCVWCHRLHDFLGENGEAKAVLTDSYEVVLVDTDTNRALMEVMQVAPRGIPYLTVLDGTGKKLVDQDTGVLESGSLYDSEKVVGFLTQWRPKREASEPVASQGTADERIAKALEIAKRDGKGVLVTVGASWCGWCQKLEEVLKSDEVGAIVNQHFVVVPLDQEKVEGTKAFRGANALDRSAGIPWYAALDATGKVVATSDVKADGNTGYPARPEEIAWFIEVLRRASPGMDQASLTRIELELKRLGAALLAQ